MDDGFSIPDHWRAGELAQAAGVSRDTLRHYERKGVLARPRRAANGYRLYPPDALRRVRLVRRALRVGFTLDELARILGERDKGGAPCRQVRALVGTKLADIREQLAVLGALRDELALMLADWDRRLAAAGAGARAELLETLAAATTADQPAINEDSSPKSKLKKRKFENEKN